MKVGLTGGLMLLACAMTVWAQEAVRLPPPVRTGGVALADALAGRQSTRDLLPEALEPETLSSLLWSAFGVNRPGEGKRTAPSAMNWREIDLYVARADGLYLYDAGQHVLAPVLPGDVRALCGKQEYVGKAPVVLVYVADRARMGEASEADRDFYSAIDTGYISQNVYLFCSASGLGTVAVGWVDRDALAKAMGLRPEQRVMLVQPVGRTVEVKPAAAGTVYRDGTYRGTGRGYEGNVTVEVTVADGRVSGVAVVEQKESAPRTALRIVPARVVARQGTAGVDAVTGATATSAGILRAVEDALSRAGMPESAGAPAQ